MALSSSTKALGDLTKVSAATPRERGSFSLWGVLADPRRCSVFSDAQMAPLVRTGCQVGQR